MSPYIGRELYILKCSNEYSHLHYTQFPDMENEVPVLKCSNNSMSELNCEAMTCFSESHSTAKNL